MAFKIIETQEELDAIISDRLGKQKASIESKYAGFDEMKAELENLRTEKATFAKSVEDWKAEKAGFESQIAEANSKIKGLETKELRTKVLLENNLGMDMLDYLRGETEEEMKQSAEFLSSKFTAANVPPLADPASGAKDTSSYSSILSQLTGE